MGYGEDFRCENCQLAFSFGMSDPLWGECQLRFVCLECGTPFTKLGDGHFWARSAPIFPGGASPAYPVHGPIEKILLDEMHKGESLAETMQETFGPETFEALLAEQAHWNDLGPMLGHTLVETPCPGCGNTGTICGRWPKKGAPCPNCGQLLKKPVRTWIS